MRKPKWRFNISWFKAINLKPRLHYYLGKMPLWKDKYNSPRCEICPYIDFSWLNFWIYIRKGSEIEWEWYLWVNHYNSGDEQLAKSNYPWGNYDKEGRFIRNQVWENYNK